MGVGLGAKKRESRIPSLASRRSSMRASPKSQPRSTETTTSRVPLVSRTPSCNTKRLCQASLMPKRTTATPKSLSMRCLVWASGFSYRFAPSIPATRMTKTLMKGKPASRACFSVANRGSRVSPMEEKKFCMASMFFQDPFCKTMGGNGYTQSLYHIFQKNATGERIFFGERENFPRKKRDVKPHT